MYTISDYASMIADPVRTDAFVCALRQVLRPGDVCLDIGTGTGYFAVLACVLGKKVIAIEPDNAIHVAREVAAANGCLDRITFIQDLSTRVHLEERADVIVSDLRGTLPLFGNHLPSLIDARKRLLAPGGILIPKMDRLWAAVVESPDHYTRAVALREKIVHDVNLEPLRRWMVNSWRKARIKPAHLLTAPFPWATVDYADLKEVNVRGQAGWTVGRSGTGHGLLLWFDTTLVEGVGLSNAPGQPEHVYNQGFFPWVHPVPLVAGDSVEVTLRADLVGSDYVWGWATRICEGEPASPVKADFRQSTFFGSALSPSSLRKWAACHRAELNEDGQIDRFILTLMNAATPIGDIAGEVAARFPGRFRNAPDALTRVGALAERYSR